MNGGLLTGDRCLHSSGCKYPWSCQLDGVAGPCGVVFPSSFSSSDESDMACILFFFTAMNHF